MQMELLDNILPVLPSDQHTTKFDSDLTTNPIYDNTKIN